ncbi:hypothetical protein [Nonomuraea sp. NPDC005650]|uniref:hypothetical protein n=1 Tax=Nonomuraea sp. NPDC005650 TaxID=3157045 RepID=UPI0033A3AA13
MRRFLVMLNRLFSASLHCTRCQERLDVDVPFPRIVSPSRLAARHAPACPGMIVERIP